jgi:hypothetical protein
MPQTKCLKLHIIAALRIYAHKKVVFLKKSSHSITLIGCHHISRFLAKWSAAWSENKRTVKELTEPFAVTSPWPWLGGAEKHTFIQANTTRELQVPFASKPQDDILYRAPHQPQAHICCTHRWPSIWTNRLVSRKHEEFSSAPRTKRLKAEAAHDLRSLHWTRVIQVRDYLDCSGHQVQNGWTNLNPDVSIRAI